MTPQRWLIAAALAACAFATPLAAQCPAPDGFTVVGACCTPVQPTLPAFPPISLPGEGNCIRDCVPGSPFSVGISLSAAAPVFCDTYLVICNVAGAVNTSGLLIAKYARTWVEAGAAGPPRQVWRFLVNGDFSYNLSPPISSPCPIPAIALAGRTVHYVGSLDYSRDCATGAVTAALALVHLCGDFVHATWSPQPIAPNPNPNFVYALVGPTPFVWGGGAPPAGPFMGDAVRSTNYNLTATPLQWTCLSELPELNGVLMNAAQYCPCASPTVPPGPAQWTQQTINFTYGACPPPLAQAYGGLVLPPLVPTGLSALPLGGWALPPTIFPGSRRIHTYFGFAQAPDPCIPIAFPFHIVNGVMTSGHSPPGIVSPPPPGTTFTSQNFLDLENTLVFIGGPPFVAIGYGGLFLASQVWSLNL